MDKRLSMAWLNDRIVPVEALLFSADDPGLTLGDGLFETMLVLDGRVRLLGAHLARLESSRVALAIPAPPVPHARMVEEVLAANHPLPPELVLRITLTAGGTTIVRPRPVTERDRARRRGLDAHILSERRGESFLARYKSLSYAANSIQRRLHPAGKSLAFEGIWLDPVGSVLEGTSTNIFAQIDDVIVTPPVSAPILPGVSRATVIARLRELAIPVAEAPIPHRDLVRAEILFATNAVLPIAPIVTLDGRPIATGASNADRYLELTSRLRDPRAAPAAS